MSIPKYDPNFTMGDLKKAGEEFLAAGRRYWEAAHKAGINGSVIWLTDNEKGFVLFSRGEYKNTLLRNIQVMGHERSFGAVGDTQEEE